MVKTLSPGLAIPPPVKKSKLNAPFLGTRETVDINKIFNKLNIINI